MRLQENRHRIFAARTYKQKDKLKAKDLEIRDQIRDVVRSTLAKPDKKLIAIQEEVIENLKRERKFYEEAKLEKRSRPVQESLFGEPSQSELGYEMVDLNKPKRDEIDEQIRYAQRKIDAENAKSKVENVLAIDKLAHMVAGWDPYDQNATSSFFDPKWMFNIENGFDIVIGNPPYGAKLSNKDREYCAQNYYSAKTIPGKQKGSLDTFSLFVEKAFYSVTVGGNTIFILPMSIVSSASMTGLHNLLYSDCEDIKCSSFAVRPQPVFENAFVNTSIFCFKKTKTPLKYLYTTKMYRKGKGFDLGALVKNLEFVDSRQFLFPGRIPKIGNSVETEILRKVLCKSPISEFISNKGSPLYYRGAGGRYFKVVTNYSTGSSAEKVLHIKRDYRDVICCILSSSLSFWFYQIYSDNLNWKSYEIENMRVPELSDEAFEKIEEVYKKYITSIEEHSNIRKSDRKSTYHVNEFKEYKIGYSKKIIDEIDDFIGPLYGLTKEEIEFIKNYEIEFRMADYLSEDELAALSRDSAQGMRLTGPGTEAVPGKTRRSVKVARPIEDSDDEELE